MYRKENELPIPPIAKSDSAARELVRVWAAKGNQHVSLATGLWDDPATWGIMLVDLARHVAQSYKQTHDRNPEEVLARIRKGLDAEWGYPTGDISSEN